MLHRLFFLIWFHYSSYIYGFFALASDYLVFHHDWLACTRQLSSSKISFWKEVLVKSGTSGYFVVYDKLPGANFTWNFNNCSCTTAAWAIACAVFLGICFLFNLPAVYSLFCSGVLDCSPAIHQRHCFPLFGAVSWNWERRLGRCGSFFLHSLCSAQQRCSQSICMHMIGGHFRWVTELERHSTSIIHFYTRIHRTMERSIYSHVKMEAKDFHIQCDKELNLHPLILLILLEPRKKISICHIFMCFWCPTAGKSTEKITELSIMLWDPNMV